MNWHITNLDEKFNVQLFTQYFEIQIDFLNIRKYI